MFFSHPGGAWGSGGILRRSSGKIAYHALPKRPQFDLYGAKRSCLLERRR